MVIYTELYGRPRSEIYYTILVHDVPEIITGDVPFIAKRKWPDLGYLIKIKEFDAEEELKLEIPELTKEEQEQVKTADLLEMLFFAVDDVKMGCEYSIDIIENILEVLPNETQIENYIRDKGYKAAIDRILAA